MKKRVLLSLILGIVLFAFSLTIVRQIECGVDTCFKGGNLCVGACWTSEERGWPKTINKQQLNNSYAHVNIYKLASIIEDIIFYQAVGFLAIQALYMTKWGKHKLK